MRAPVVAYTWTDARKAAGAKLWFDGHSGKEVAEMLSQPGFQPTRDAVIGMAWREGWQRSDKFVGTWTNKPWSAETTAKAKAMFIAGERPSDIHRKLSIGLKSLWSKIRREKWKELRPPELAPGKGREPSDLPVVKRSGKTARPVLSAITGGIVQPMIRPPKVEVRAKAWTPLEGSTPKTLTDRTGCKWPVGGQGADMLFCDEPISDRDPCWCQAHRMMGRVRSAA